MSKMLHRKQIIDEGQQIVASRPVADWVDADKRLPTAALEIHFSCHFPEKSISKLNYANVIFLPLTLAQLRKCESEYRLGIETLTETFLLKAIPSLMCLN